MSTQFLIRNYYETRSSELITDNEVIFRDQSSFSFHQLKSEKSVVDFYKDNDCLMLSFRFFWTAKKSYAKAVP